MARGRSRAGLTSRLGLVLSLALAAGLTYGLWLAGAPLLWAWLAGAGLATVGALWWDKRQSQLAGAARIPERDLLVLVALGVLGGWIGMSLLRHKSRHTRFQLVLALATMAWGAAAWLSLR